MVCQTGTSFLSPWTPLAGSVLRRKHALAIIDNGRQHVKNALTERTAFWDVSPVYIQLARQVSAIPATNFDICNHHREDAVSSRVTADVSARAGDFQFGGRGPCFRKETRRKS